MSELRKYSSFDPDKITHRLWVTTPCPEFGCVSCQLVVVLDGEMHGTPTSCHCLFPTAHQAQRWTAHMGMTWHQPHPDASSVVLGSAS